MMLPRRWRGVAVAAVAAGAIALPSGAASAQTDVPGLPEIPNPLGDLDGTDDAPSPNPTTDTVLPGNTGFPPAINPVAPNPAAPAPDAQLGRGRPKPLPQSARATRDRIFGKGWDNPDQVRARPIGNTTWLVSYGGNVVAHDSTMEDQLTDTGQNKNTNGYVSLNDAIEAKPTAILQDHTHFDQQHNAPELAAGSGAPIVTDLGGCTFTKENALEKGIDPAAVRCNLIRDPEGKPFFSPDTFFVQPYGGQGIAFTDYGEEGHPEKPIPGLETQAVQLKHSPSFTGRPYPKRVSGPNVDPLARAQDIVRDYSKVKNPSEIAENIYATYAPFDLEGSNVGWLVKYNDFSLFHHGSSGSTYDLEPGAKKIRESLEKLGAGDRIDVELGSVAEMTFLTDGHYFEDAKQYAKAIGAKQFFPVHHYNWYPGWLTNPAAAYWPGLKATWSDGVKEAKGNFPNLCYLTEENYATLWNFNVADWKGDQVGTPKPMTGPGCYSG